MCFSVAKAYLSSQASSILPTTSDSTSPDGKKTLLKGRIDFHWRMIPPLVAIIASIAAVAYCVMMGHFYLTILFSAGFIGSLYALYLAHQYKHLKTFGENNEQFQTQLETLRKELQSAKQMNETMQKTSEGLKSSLEAAEKNVGLLDNSVKVLNVENGELKESVKSVKSMITEVTEQRDQYKKLHEAHVKQLENLASTFGAIQTTAFTQSSDLKFQIDTFKTVVDSLKANQTSLDSNFLQTNQIVDTVKDQMTQLLVKQAEFVNTITNADQYVAFTKSVRELESLASERTKQLAVSQSQIEQNQKILEDIRKQIEENKKLNEQLKESATKITTNMQRMSAHTHTMESMDIKLNNKLSKLDQATDDLMAKRASFRPYNSVPTPKNVTPGSPVSLNDKV